MANNPIQIPYSGTTTNTPSLGVGAGESNIALNGPDELLFYYDGTTTKAFDLTTAGGASVSSVYAALEEINLTTGSDIVAAAATINTYYKWTTSAVGEVSAGGELTQSTVTDDITVNASGDGLTYLVSYSCTVGNSTNNTDITAAIFNNGVVLSGSECRITADNNDSLVSHSFLVTLNNTDNLDLRMKISDTTLALKVYNVSFNVIALVGATGATGATGADGDITWEGDWVSQNYTVNQAVKYSDGSSYVCILNTISNEVPTNATYWDLLAEKGDTGATGAPATPTFISADQVITPAGSLTIAHGLTNPTQSDVTLINVTAQHGWSPGDMVALNGMPQNNNNDQGIAVWLDGTNVNARYGSGSGAGTPVFEVMNKTTGNYSTITNANWKIRIKVTQ